MNGSTGQWNSFMCCIDQGHLLIQKFGEVVIRYIYLFSERFLGLVAQIPYLEHFLKLRAFSTSERMFGTDRAILALFPESLGPSVPCAAFQCAHQHVCIVHATGIDFGGIPAVAGMFR